jgi:hypothetical protein
MRYAKILSCRRNSHRVTSRRVSKCTHTHQILHRFPCLLVNESRFIRFDGVLLMWPISGNLENFRVLVFRYLISPRMWGKTGIVRVCTKTNLITRNSTKVTQDMCFSNGCEVVDGRLRVVCIVFSLLFLEATPLISRFVFCFARLSALAALESTPNAKRSRQIWYAPFADSELSKWFDLDGVLRNGVSLCIVLMSRCFLSVVVWLGEAFVIGLVYKHCSLSGCAHLWVFKIN